VTHTKSDSAAFKYGSANSVSIANVDVLHSGILRKVATPARDVFPDGSNALSFSLDYNSVRLNKRVRHQTDRKQSDASSS
jgi:hypothetical protein